MRRLLEEGEAALAERPKLLAVPREAGVVDAGGKGFVRMFEGVVRYIEGDPILAVSAGVRDRRRAGPAALVEVAAERDFQFCTEVLVRGEQLPPANEVRAAMHTFGGSVVVAVAPAISSRSMCTPTPPRPSLAMPPGGDGWRPPRRTTCGRSTARLAHPERRAVDDRDRHAPPTWPTRCWTAIRSRWFRSRWSSATRASGTGSSSSRRSSTAGSARRGTCPPRPSPRRRIS